MKRLTGTALLAFKQDAIRKRRNGMSYAAIGRSYGLSPWTVRYHINEEVGALRRSQMHFYNYLRTLDDETDIHL